jgi:urea transporter
MNHPFDHFTKSTLRSSAQIMLQVNSITGLIFLIGIGINSVAMLLGCLLSISSSLVTAKLCQYDSRLINKGIYSYSAALVGISVFTLLQPSLIAFMIAISGGVLSVMIMHFMITKVPSMAALTTPFILSTWVIVLIIDYLGLAIPILDNQTGSVNQEMIVTPITLSFVEALESVFRGVGQVMLQDNWFSGAVFCCGLLFSSYRVALWAVLASLIGFVIAIWLGFSQEKAIMGLYSFNACLVAITLLDRYPNKYWLILFATFLSVLITRAFEEVTIPALTTPFVMTIWIIIGLVKLRATFDKEEIKSR